MMDAAPLDIGAGIEMPRLDPGRLRDLILLRIAYAGKALPRETVVRDFAPFAAALTGEHAWKSTVERDLAALADAGLIEVRPSSVAVSDAGAKRAEIMLSVKGAQPKSWSAVRDIYIIARILGLEREAPRRLKTLAKPDGLRTAIVVKAFGLKIRGVPSPVRLRSALTKVALARAFGSDAKPESGKTGLSAKAGRALAGQLSSQPQDFRTDSRLIAALAAENVGADTMDFAGLQRALIRRYLTKGGAAAPAATKPKRKARKVVSRVANKSAVVTTSPTMPAQPSPAKAAMLAAVAAASPAATLAPQRPDLVGFVTNVKQLAATVAQGWPGNRKAFISKVWSVIAAERAEWALSEIEFKCMLAEAHRLGQIVLANADLKDDRNLAEVQASAVAYRNAVFHFVRVDD